MPEAIVEPVRAGLGLRHALWVYTTPRRVFNLIEDTGAYGWALVTLLVLVMLIGYLQVQTGLIDRIVDEQTEKNLAELEKSRTDLVDRIDLKNAMEDVRKAGEFMKTVTRLQAVALKPGTLLAKLLLISSVLYAVVALTGRKPEYHTLMSICTYSAFIWLVAELIRFGMMVHYRSTTVDTSLRLLSPGDGPNPLAAVDPFRIWFWILVGIGLVVTRQLSRRAAVITCAVLLLVTTGGRVAMEFAGSS